MFETIMNLLETIQKKNNGARVLMEAFVRFCKEFYNMVAQQVETCIEEAIEQGYVLCDDCGRLSSALL